MFLNTLGQGCEYTKYVFNNLTQFHATPETYGMIYRDMLYMRGMYLATRSLNHIVDFCAYELFRLVLTRAHFRQKYP